MKQFKEDPYLQVDREYERAELLHEQRISYIDRATAEILGAPLSDDLSDALKEAVNDRIAGFTDSQWDTLTDLLIKLALGDTVTRTDSHTLLDYSDLAEVAEAWVDLEEEI